MAVLFMYHNVYKIFWDHIVYIIDYDQLLIKLFQIVFANARGDHTSGFEH